jgi:hypothetical protein
MSIVPDNIIQPLPHRGINLLKNQIEKTNDHNQMYFV